MKLFFPMVLQLVQFEGGPRCPCSLRSQWPWRVWRLSRSSNLDTLTFYLGAVNGQRSSSFWFKSHDFPAVIPPSTPLTTLAELHSHSRIIGSWTLNCHWHILRFLSCLLIHLNRQPNPVEEVSIIHLESLVVVNSGIHELIHTNRTITSTSLRVTSSSNISYHIIYLYYNIRSH